MKEKTERVLRWSFKILTWFCPEHLYEEIQGDLIQTFSRDLVKHGEAKATTKLALSVLFFAE